MNNYLDPDHWVNEGEHEDYHPDAMAMATMQQEVDASERKLKTLYHLLIDALWVADQAVNCVTDKTAANTFAEQLSDIRKKKMEL